jgi:hypothetical protein
MWNILTAGCTFAGLTTTVLEVDPENSVFGRCEDFIVNLVDNSLVRYFGADKEVLIGSSVAGIAAGCFRNLKTVSTVRFETGSRISFFGPGVFMCCYGLKSISIPATLESIPDDCFKYCASLQAVTFESGSRVSGLGDKAFEGCTVLASICLPSSVTRIGAQCFVQCVKLATVTVERGIQVSFIGPKAFSDCSSSLRLPAELIKQ